MKRSKLILSSCAECPLSSTRVSRSRDDCLQASCCACGSEAVGGSGISDSGVGEAGAGAFSGIVETGLELDGSATAVAVAADATGGAACSSGESDLSSPSEVNKRLSLTLNSLSSLLF